ncbi:MAG: hypothetical protein EAZ24_06815 [Burkholderiales bacterium]|nr:MAG: hypothetical protein EAZ24_06815 [Burkholderiales bacterium]TAG84359.1 MAG: hypothetical protein EAZ21_00575 [Betaproteobacteria bacterium]
MRSLRISLVLLGLAAVCAAAWPFIQRQYAAHQQAAAERARSEALAAQTSQLKSEFAAERVAIMKRLNSLVESKQYAEALKLASKYRATNDPELTALINTAGTALSGEQLLSRMQQLVAKSCTGVQAKVTASRLLAAAYPDVKDASTQDWSVERIEIEGVLPAIRKRLADVSTDAVAGSTNARTLQLLRGKHTMRLHPLVRDSLLRAPDGAQLTCAWRVSGTWPSASGSGQRLDGFTMQLWFAPSLTERTLEHDVLDYAQTRGRR